VNFHAWKNSTIFYSMTDECIGSFDQ
jgi:hypothetical protein